ncbi:MAG: flagellar basal body rod C-terminal domain-containing protein [Succinivibrio sp.]
MSIDLILTGKYGVLNSQKLLSATSNNINNVNTEGYIRKQTMTYTSCVDWGVGDTYTRRVYDKYVQRQLFTDTGAQAYYSAYAEGLGATDKILSDEDMSIANSVTKFFDELSNAVNSPTSTASRNAAKAALENVVERITTANNSMIDSLTDVNSKITDDVDDINSYTLAICKINDQIRSLGLSDNATNNEIYMQMLDERDRLIGLLAEKVSINVEEQSDKTYAVYMDSGMLLANGDTYAKLENVQNQFDNTKAEIFLSYESLNGLSKNDNTHIMLNNNNIGGSLGGYVNSSTEIRNAMRELGKITASLADALNVQNKSGFTLDDIAGSNILNIQGSWATTNQPTSNNSLYCSFIEGQGTKYQSYDFQVSYQNGALSIYRVEEGEKKVDITSEIAAGNITVADDAAAGTSTITLKDYGLTFTLNRTQAELEGDKTVFYVQPTMMVGSTVTSNISKPEDFAFASAVKTSTASNNYGNATISLSRCDHTGDDYGVSVNATTGKPEFNSGAPVTIKIDNQGNYLIYDVENPGVGDLPIGIADKDCKGVNVLANAVYYTGYTIGGVDVSGQPLKDYGYDVSVTGTVKDNDTFYIQLNTGGLADNSNGNALISLRNTEIVRTTGSDKLTTFNSSYANLLAQLGSCVSAATANEEAATAKLNATTELYQSSAGVNLDEEAANLLMFQQSYSSCAKIIEAAQTVFNALLSAM